MQPVLKRNLHHASLLPADTCYRSTPQPKLPSATGTYFKFRLISPEHVLLFFCPPFRAWLSLLALFPCQRSFWLQLFHEDHFLARRPWTVPGSRWFLPVLSWWHCWTSPSSCPVFFFDCFVLFFVLFQKSLNRTYLWFRFFFCSLTYQFVNW